MNEVVQLLENNKNILGPDGKLLTNHENNSNILSSNGKDCTNSNKTATTCSSNANPEELSCNICNKKYSTEKRLNFIFKQIISVQHTFISAHHVYKHSYNLELLFVI